MIAIIDYGGGNTGSLYAALRRLTPNVTLTGDPATLRNASAAVLPGDGAFNATISALRERSLLPEIESFLASGRPFLGICVGMQILYEGSEEFGETRGLGFFSGRISRFRNARRIPHIGWSPLSFQQPHAIVRGLGTQECAYFMHSYRADIAADTLAAADVTPSNVAGSTTLTGGNDSASQLPGFSDTTFTAICARDNAIGMQFHPEKSQKTGAILLANFVRMSMREENDV